jgi:hypothetical protein
VLWPALLRLTVDGTTPFGGPRLVPSDRIWTATVFPTATVASMVIYRSENWASNHSAVRGMATSVTVSTRTRPSIAPAKRISVLISSARHYCAVKKGPYNVPPVSIESKCWKTLTTYESII